MMTWRAFWDRVAGLLAGALTEERLRGAAMSPETLSIAGTFQTTLPTFGAPAGAPPGVRESRDLGHCHPELQRRFRALCADFEREHGRQLILTSTYRSPERQAELYAQGRTAPGQIVTKLDGKTKKSRHNVYPAQAVDVAVDVDPGPGKHVVWVPAAYAPLGPLAARHGLVWGGAWASFPDYPHLELPAGAA